VEVAEVVGELLAGSGRVDPYPVYEQIRAYGPLVRVQERFWVATGYAAIDELLRDPRMLVPSRELASFYGPADGPATAEEAVVGQSMLRANGADHARMRRLAHGTFTPRRLESMRVAITTQATTLTSYLEYLVKTGEPVDFMTEFAYPLPIRVICALLGVPAADQHWFREQAAALTSVLEPSMLMEDMSSAVQARARLDLYFSDLVATRRRSPADDLVTALAHSDELSPEELLANLVLLLVAGFETTANLLGNGMAVLLANPALRPYAGDAFVEEVLRHDAPVQITSRWCREPVTIAGANLEPYSQVLVFFGAGNRDPYRYPRPEVFDPTRPGIQPLTFGAGPHHCLGAALARMEAQIALPMLVQRLPQLRPHGQPVRKPRLTLRGYAELPVSA
jgi:cytochrome P450